MDFEALHDLAGAIATKGAPVDAEGKKLSRSEIQEVMRFCRKNICDADMNHAYKLFYSYAYDILLNEITPNVK